MQTLLFSFDLWGYKKGIPDSSDGVDSSDAVAHDTWDLAGKRSRVTGPTVRGWEGLEEKTLSQDPGNPKAWL